jgi:hypothetical protein
MPLPVLTPVSSALSSNAPHRLCTSKQQHTARQHCLCAASKDGYKVVVLGGGSGGSAVAAHYCRKLGKGQVAVVDPAGGCHIKFIARQRHTAVRSLNAC